MKHFQKYCFILISALLYILFSPADVRTQASDMSENMPGEYYLWGPDTSLATDIGSQGQYNTCWAYSALGSIQTQLKKKG